MNIFALSSGRGPCGIAIIRLSGPDTISICKLISKENKIKENEINLCKFFDPRNDAIIDDYFIANDILIPVLLSSTL